MSNKSRLSSKMGPTGGRRGGLVRDSLADIETFVLTDLQEFGVEFVLRKAGEMSSLLSYRERVEEALRLYVPSEELPWVVLELNKRILAAADKKRQEKAMPKATAPNWTPCGKAKCVGVGDE